MRSEVITLSIRSIISAGALIACFFLAGCVGNGGVGTAIKLADYQIGRAQLIKMGVDEEDQRNLESGNLLAVKRKYQARSRHDLTDTQLRILCDIEVKFNDLESAHECLDILLGRLKRMNDEDAGPRVEAILGRKTLLFLYVNKMPEAVEISRNLETVGGRFVHGLALAKNDDRDEAQRIAEWFSRYYFMPERIYYAANIYLALEEYERALELLLDPRTRLLRDYGLASYTGVLGNKVESATFRIDLFEEFKFGYFDVFSYAPKANIYVEFTAAKSYLETGQIEKAERHFEAIINYIDSGAFRDIYWMSLFEAGRIKEKQGDDAGAIDLYMKAVDLIEGIRASIATEAGRLGFFRDKFDVYARLVSLQEKRNLTINALETVERAKSRALVDLLASRTEFAPNELDDDKSSRLLNSLMLAESKYAVRAVSDGRDLLTQLREISDNRNALIQEAPHMASLVTIPPMNFDRLTSILKEGEAGLLYHQFNEKLYIFYFGKDIVKVKSVDASRVEKEASILRETLMEYDQENYLEHTKRLYDMIVRPMESHIGDSRNLLIIPTNVLHYVPFSVLHDGNDYLIKRFTIRIAPSLNVLTLLSHNRARNENLLIIGNPDLKDEEMDLPGAENEARAIAANYPGSLLLLRQHATETAFYDLSPGYGLIHIASHGKFQTEKPLQSRLLLASTDKNNGDLTVNDLFMLRLQARLVVLSACETALSYISSGDDLVGLLQGFFYAGTQGVVGSLWLIEDNSTSMLMQNLYQNLYMGIPPGEALRKAQLMTMKKYPHPFFWGAFQYSGSEA